MDTSRPSWFSLRLIDKGVILISLWSFVLLGALWLLAPPAFGGASIGEPTAVCLSGADLAVVDGPSRRVLPPPVELEYLAAAGDSLVGVARDKIYQLCGRGQERRWRIVGSIGNSETRRPLRVASRGDQAVIFLAGNDPGTIRDVLSVGPDGAIQSVARAQWQTIQAVWGMAPLSGPQKASPFPSALLPVVERAKKAGQEAEPSLVFDETTPFHERWVAPQTRLDGDWPSGDLFRLEGDSAIPILFNEKPLDYRGVLAWTNKEVLFDARFAGCDSGVIVIRSKGDIRLVRELAPPCAAVRMRPPEIEGFPATK